MAETQAYRRTPVDGEPCPAQVIEDIGEITRRLLLPESFNPHHQQLLDLEQEVQQAMGRAGDRITAQHIQQAHNDDAFVQESRRAAYAKADDHGIRLRSKGRKPVTIRLLGGTSFTVKTPYLRRDLRGRRGRRRGVGKRREKGSGVYPVLEALGIADRCTPATRSEIALHTVVCCSYEEARQQLARRGLQLDITTIRTIAVSVGSQAMALRDAALAVARQIPVPREGPMAGRRVRISLDGGRTRTRRTKKHARKGKNGRRPFETAWREPRILTIDVLNEEGDSDPGWRPIYDVSLGNADVAFALLVGHLRWLGVAHAREVEFVADGAEWMWNRLDALLRKAEIPQERFHPVLDYYHATEHIDEILDLCRGMNKKAKKKELDRLSKQLLEEGGAKAVVDDLRTLAKGRRARKIKDKIKYLVKHLPHMDYAGLKARRLPIGSGIVESAVRRVNNLRFKGASIFWKEENLEPLLFLRAVWKSGWWEELSRGLSLDVYYLAFQFPESWISAA